MKRNDLGRCIPGRNAPAGVLAGVYRRNPKGDKMKVQFDVSEIERKTYTVELPDGMDVSGWTPEQMDELGEAVYAAHWHQTDALDRLAADWKFVRVTDSETDHSIDGFYFETNGSSTTGRF